MSPLSPPSSLASLSPHSALLTAPRLRPRRHRSDLDLPPDAEDDVMAPPAPALASTSVTAASAAPILAAPSASVAALAASSTATTTTRAQQQKQQSSLSSSSAHSSSSRGLTTPTRMPPPSVGAATAAAATSSSRSLAAAATPNSHVSSDNDPSTDGSRSIPNVDLHTLAHLLSPASNRPPHNGGAASAGGGSHGNAKIGYHGRYQNAKDAHLSHHRDRRVLTDHSVCTPTSPPTLLSSSSSSLSGAAIGIGGGSGNYGGQIASPTTPVFRPIRSDIADLTARPSASSIARPRPTRPDDLASPTNAAAAAAAAALSTSSSSCSSTTTGTAAAAAARHNNTTTQHDYQQARQSKISWHRARTELAQTLIHSPALSDSLHDSEQDNIIDDDDMDDDDTVGEHDTDADDDDDNDIAGRRRHERMVVIRHGLPPHHSQHGSNNNNIGNGNIVNSNSNDGDIEDDDADIDVDLDDDGPHTFDSVARPRDLACFRHSRRRPTASTDPRSIQSNGNHKHKHHLRSRHNHQLQQNYNTRGNTINNISNSDNNNVLSGNSNDKQHALRGGGGGGREERPGDLNNNPTRRHRSDGVVAAWPRAQQPSPSAARLPDMPTAPWPSSLHPAASVRVGDSGTGTVGGGSSPGDSGARRRRRSSHLAGALRRKVSSVWGTSSSRAATTNAPTSALSVALTGGDDADDDCDDDVDDCDRDDEDCDNNMDDDTTATTATTTFTLNSRTLGGDSPSGASGVRGSGYSNRTDTSRRRSNMGGLNRKLQRVNLDRGRRVVTEGDLDPEKNGTDAGGGDGDEGDMKSGGDAGRGGGAAAASRAMEEPVYPYAGLAPFGLSPAGDAIVLYTNSVRAEVNDMIFLATLLRRAGGVEGASIRKRHRNLDVDFELWFTRFAHYCNLVLFGIEELVMRAVAEVLGQRDVMLSRAAAAAEAGGSASSRVAAWHTASRALYGRMDAMRAGLNDVASAVVWLRRARALRENPAQAGLRAVAGVRKLAPAALALMDEVDARVGEALALQADWSKALRGLYRQFAAVLAREGAAPLGWGAVVTLTRWIADRRLRAEHVKNVARAARLGMFARFKGDCSHQAIVRVHRTLAADDSSRRVRFFV